ncbi:RNA chaperone Hfq [Clostridium boliviensis]|uniref:RNA chaperone Hfq n=1 Tax=Clostridium boliviensis TaxID=318465 RepID=A0ABU4GL83_9CLOT|nr:RNA chaperone Hfq [Clostridium boliviensis]MDW2798364.1 RNA chaperone Hfq [Clostridium boliviensis]
MQDPQLNKLRKRRVPVTIFMTNGARVKGIIQGFDRFTITLEHQGKQQSLFKHAVSTVIASKYKNDHKVP